MGLDKLGMMVLADDLVAHQDIYDQGSFRTCLAAFCYVRQKMNGDWKRFDDRLHEETALHGTLPVLGAGIRQLGLRAGRGVYYSIFGKGLSWPPDLFHEYFQALTQREKVIAVLKALQRLDDDGEIDSNSSAVHTRLPQLEALLNEPKRKTAADYVEEDELALVG
jgi:hypothetical protein